jgi:hypothetical protein
MANQGIVVQFPVRENKFVSSPQREDQIWVPYNLSNIWRGGGGECNATPALGNTHIYIYIHAHAQSHFAYLACRFMYNEMLDPHFM